MHKGRTYPFAPLYWATEAWFWPGYVPWKMIFTRVSDDGDPWNKIPNGTTRCSGEIFYTPDAKICAWEWDLSDIAPDLSMAVTFSKLEAFGVFYALAVLALNDPSALTPSTANSQQAYPQRRVSVGSFNQVIATPPYTYVGAINIAIRPATYAEGGSPWG
jgi:hypothetical protein